MLILIYAAVLIASYAVGSIVLLISPKWDYSLFNLCAFMAGSIIGPFVFDLILESVFVSGPHRSATEAAIMGYVLLQLFVALGSGILAVYLGRNIAER